MIHYSDSPHSAQQSDGTMPDAFIDQSDPLERSEPAPDSIETSEDFSQTYPSFLEDSPSN